MYFFRHTGQARGKTGHDAEAQPILCKNLRLFFVFHAPYTNFAHEEPRTLAGCRFFYMTIKEFIKKVLSIRIWGNCLGVIIVSVLLMAGELLFIRFYTHHGEVIEMPDICGQNSDVAIKKLKALGLHAEVTDTGFVRTLPPGIILEQSIAKGTEIKPGRLVTLTINSAGSPTIALPDLADNSSLREAQTRLKAIGFKLAPPELIIGEKDWVYGVKVNGRTVSAGTRVAAGAAITLVVGNGENEEEFNGNDSLDYVIFGDDAEEAMPDESVGYEEETASDMPAEESGKKSENIVEYGE